MTNNYLQTYPSPETPHKGDVSGDAARYLQLLASVHKPKTILEIGSRAGASSSWLCRSFSHPIHDCTFISIDIIPEDLEANEFDDNLRHFVSFGGNVKKFWGKPSRDVVKDVQSFLSENDRVVDFLFIDGDHTYLGAKQDLQAYAPMVDKSGGVCMHDVFSQPGVSKLWKELSFPRLAHRSNDIGYYKRCWQQ